MSLPDMTTYAAQQEEEKRHEEFGSWLDSQDLPEELRIAISLRELEGLSYEEIAAAMDCPIGTVRSRIFRAREAINQRLGPLLD